MGDTPEGSSNAAQSAQADEARTEHDTPGLWERIFSRGGKDEDAPEPTIPSGPVMSEAAGARAMLLNIRAMQGRRVQDVAVPLADIEAIPVDATLEETITAFRDSANTRLPVFRETLDTPLGFVHLKDVVLHYGFGSENAADFDLEKLLRPLLYVPPSMPLGKLLQKMQNDRIHMALVIDEYGGVDGLVTIEDLLEEIVGEIEDEHDEVETQGWVPEAPNVYVAQARASLEGFEAEAGVDLLPDDLDEDVDTLGGLVFMLSGRVPARGECIRDSHGHEFEVIDADARRIKRLRVRLNPDQIQERAAE